MHIYSILVILFLCCSMQVIATLDKYWDEKENVTVGPGRNDRRPGGKGLSTKSLAYRRDKS